MSYCATFSGVLFMDADKEKVDAVKAFLDKGLVVEGVDVSIDDSKQQATIEFVSDGLANYDEEDIFVVLGNLKDYISSGEIEYHGEDDTYWKHEFKEGKWSELSGKIVYSNPVELMVQSEKETDESLKDMEM